MIYALAVAAVAAAAAALVALPASGFVDRHLRVESTAVDYGRWIAARPGFRDGNRAISSAGSVDGALVGDRLRHPVRLIPRNEGCGRLRRRVLEEWVVLPIQSPGGLLRVPPASGRRLVRLYMCLAALKPVYRDDLHLVYGAH